MATSQRRSDVALIERLFEEPFRFDFFQAVRLLERIGKARAPVGFDGPYARETVRFAQHVSMNFPASAIDTLERDAQNDDAPPRMVTSFIGLLGASGALPTVYTEELVGPRGKNRGPAVDFFNLFHHRIVSLFYRAWEKYHLPAQWEKSLDRDRRPGGDDEDRFTASLFHLLGLGLGSLRERQGFDDESLLFYTGVFAQQHRSAVMLERLIADCFGHPAEVLSFTGQWLRLRPEEQSRMGRTGGFNRLGREAVAGRKVWDVQSKFRLRLGPLTFAAFREFLPDGAASNHLMSLVRFYTRSELDFDVQLILKKEDVPMCELSRGPTAARLGRTSWLKQREFEYDAGDAIFKPGR
ncbi:MAG: type VI secretion system baseplate subunit TssG [Paludisphaera borealis]|uniref:type VI secretion system baseplate subunit TssG n=1 Tax=Paludisphaera borealis TaxID=1387353 RepID=UPI00284ACC02|nr:type VI secretion system baseplate subunit TssG [Paludisphaera borealis]MDR3618410.1 type VI secretion system baseplate subunit TssG [Paludisphaera borealis]